MNYSDSSHVAFVVSAEVMGFVVAESVAVLSENGTGEAAPSEKDTSVAVLSVAALLIDVFAGGQCVLPPPPATLTLQRTLGALQARCTIKRIPFATNRNIRRPMRKWAQLPAKDR